MELHGRTRFGARLRRLRKSKGLTQAQLAHPGMSAGYLSRLESGTRAPTETAVAYLAKRLAVSTEELMHDDVPSLSHTLAILAAASHEPSGAADRAAFLQLALERDCEADALARCHALWLLAVLHEQAGRFDHQVRALRRTVSVADNCGEIVMRVRARARLAGCLRTTATASDLDEAVHLAAAALSIADTYEADPATRAEALMATLSVNAEAGFLDPPRKVDEERIDRLADLATALPPLQRAQALWTAAAALLYQGYDKQALRVLELALNTIGSGDDLLIWARLRLAGARIHLAAYPPRTDTAAELLRQAEPAVALLAVPKHLIEHAALRARLLFLCGQAEEAGELLAQLDGSADCMDPRDVALFRLLGHQLKVLSGDDVPAAVSDLVASIDGSRMSALGRTAWSELSVAMASRSSAAARPS